MELRLKPPTRFGAIFDYILKLNDVEFKFGHIYKLNEINTLLKKSQQ